MISKNHLQSAGCCEKSLLEASTLFIVYLFYYRFKNPLKMFSLLSLCAEHQNSMTLSAKKAKMTRERDRKQAEPDDIKKIE
jgi:hypothetical protein